MSLPIALEFLTASVFFGMLCGALVSGIFSDRLGRKPTLLGSLIVNGISGLVASVSPGPKLLIAMRIISGIGVGGAIPSVFTLIAELVPAASRGFYITLVSAFFMVVSKHDAARFLFVSF